MGSIRLQGPAANGGITARSRLGAATLALGALVIAAWLTAPRGWELSIAQYGGPDIPSVTAAQSKLRLSFVRNAGQTDAGVHYEARGTDFAYYFRRDRVVLAYERGRRGIALNLGFVGANGRAHIQAGPRGSGSVSYIASGTGPLPTYRTIAYRDLWPGIDMVFRGSGARLKYEFVVHPGADPAAIRLSYQGASSLTLGAGGEMRIGTPLGTLRDAPPRSWQRSRSGRAPVSSRYAIQGRRYGFEVGAYDRARTLVIDPGLEYSTRLGPSGTDAAAVAADEHGHAYVVGASSSPAYPTTPGAFETEADRFGVGFVTKLSANGSDLVYSTYLGSGITGMALDAHGNVFVVGFARNDFPTTAGAYRETTTKPTDSFVAKLDATGSTLVYGTFLGASYLGGSGAASIAVDEAGAAYITGGTSSADYPLTPGAFDSTLDHQPEGAVAKLDPAGSSLVYSTFYGGAYSNAIAVDGEGNAYVTGSSPSPQDFPTTEAAYDRSPNGGWDTFVTKFSPEGSLVYSTLLGGLDDDWSDGIALDGVGHAYITGTAGRGFPVTPGAFDTTGPGRGFVAKLVPTGSFLSYATRLGGSLGRDEPNAIAVDRHGSAHVTGLTSSEDFPVTPDAYQSTLDGSESSPDAFVTRLAPDGSTLGYSTFFGGSSFEQGNGIAVDRRGDAYFIGEGGASTPTTPGAYDTTSVFGEFVAKLDIGPGAAARLELSPSSAENEVDTEHCVTALVADSGGRPVWDVLVRFSVSGANASSGSAPTDDDGRARFCYPGLLLGTDSISAYADFDPANGTREPSEPTGTAIKVWLPRRPFCRAHVSGSGWSERTRLMPEFVATSTAVRGRVVYREPGGPAFRSSRLVATSCDPDGRVSVFGTAQVGGSPLQFRLDLEDHGEPGRDSDIFRMRVAGGYDSGVRVLSRGNLRVMLR